MKLGVLVLSLLFVTAGRASQKPAVPTSDPAPTAAQAKDIATLQGDWMITWMNDQEIPAEAEAYLVFKGDKYEQWTGNQVDERGSITIDVTSTLKKIDLIITEGQSAGQTQLGVYELTADTMTVALANPGSTVRPASLTMGDIYAVLKKAK